MASVEESLAALIDDREFRGIHQQLRRFNMFDALGAVRVELRHSNFLNFILSPNRSHGIGGDLLGQFIRAAIDKLPMNKRPISALELITADLDNAILYRERNNIDLLVELKSLGLIVVVENKIDSDVGDGQLARYLQSVRANYPGLKHLFILLTPDGREPDEEEYVRMSYSEVAIMVERIVLDQEASISPDLALILRHYVEMLRRHIVDDEKLMNIARLIYEKHKEALDFIFEHRPQPDNLLAAIREVVKQDTRFVSDRDSPMILRFAPVEWNGVAHFNACPATEWTRTRRSMLFEIKANRESDRVSIALVLGPANADLRSRLYAYCGARPDTFVNLVKPMGAKYTTVFIRDLLSAKAAADMEPDEKTSALEKAWNDFLARDLPAIKSELQNF
jgi:hypothetical protein